MMHMPIKILLPKAFENLDEAGIIELLKLMNDSIASLSDATRSLNHRVGRLEESVRGDDGDQNQKV